MFGTIPEPSSIFLLNAVARTIADYYKEQLIDLSFLLGIRALLTVSEFHESLASAKPIRLIG